MKYSCYSLINKKNLELLKIKQGDNMETKNMKRLFVCDLDGVLVGSDGKIRSQDIDSIRKFMDEGGDIVICTGRLDQDIQYVENKIGVQGKYRISQNGAVIKNDRDEIVYHKKIDKDYIPVINEIVSQYDVRTEINNVDNRHFPSPRAPEEIAEFIDTSIVVEDLFQFAENELEPTIYLNFGTVKEFNEIKEQIQNRLGNKVTVVQTSETSLEIFSNEASKGKALKYIAGRLKVDKEEIIVAGDAESDVTMFPYAGVSYAVSQEAGDIVIEQADHHVMTVESLLKNHL